MKKKVQIYDYVFNIEISDDDGKTVIGSNCHMKGRLPADITEDELKQGMIYQDKLFNGNLQWLLQQERIITLPTHNIMVSVVDVIYDGSIKFAGGGISSNLKETCPYCKDTDCDFDCPIESMVLNHAIAGVNIESTAYLEGLEAAIDAVSNNV